MSKDKRLKTRREFPPFLKLILNFDFKKLVEAFESFKDYNSYTDLEPVVDGSAYKALCWARKSLHSKFLSQDELKKSDGFLSSQQYRQLALTCYEKRLDFLPDIDPNQSFTSYKKTTLIGNKKYVHAFDERNYTKRNHLCTGFWNEVLDSFKGPVTRTRFAYLAPNSVIRPHIDYNTDYSVRVHIPIVTNPDALLCVEDLEGNKFSVHAPADGSVYFINTGLKHWAENNGSTERVHLIISLNGQEDLEGSYEWPV